MNGSEPARIAAPPAWATESQLNEDTLTVVHDRQGATSFQASTGNLRTPLVSQHVHIEQTDRLRLLRTEDEINAAVGLVCDREPVEVVLTQDEDGRPFPVEVASWPIDEARKLHKALGDLIDAYDTAGGE